MTIPLHSRRTAKPCQFRTSPRSFSPRCSLALVTNFSHSSLRVFRDLRTLSFSGSQLSRVLSAVCALFRKKPGVHSSNVIPRFILPLHTRSPLACPERSAPSAPRVPHRGRRLYPEHGRTANQLPLFTVDCRLSAVGQSRATSSIPFISPAYEHRPRISLVSPTYAKTGGRRYV